ncbi:MAG: septum formation initiator family protein [Flavobacteriales bacterium]|nr:septum formation initiator family protein [Flavobacteriales bacterium]
MKEKISSFITSHPAIGKSYTYMMSHKMLIIIVAALLWIVFFDKNSVILHMEREKNISALQDSIKYYREEITRQKRHLDELQSDPRQMEKFVRERYNMKKDDEDIYIIKRQ